MSKSKKSTKKKPKKKKAEPLKGKQPNFKNSLVDNVLEKVKDTADLITEPEFDGLYFDPTLLIQRAIEAKSKINKRLRRKKKIKNHETAELQALIEILSEEFLTPQYIDWIYTRVADLHERAEEERNPEMIEKTRAIMELLNWEGVEKYITRCGLYQSIMMRSLQVGTRLIEILSSELPDEQEADEQEPMEDLFANQNILDQVLALDEEFPGFSDYLNSDLDTETEVDALAVLLFSGVLFLDIYSQKALEDGLRLIYEFLDEELVEWPPDENIFSLLPELSQQQMTQLNNLLQEFILKMDLEELSDAMYDSLSYIFENIELDEEVYDLVDLVLDEFDELDEETLRYLAVAAFWGELREYLRDEDNSGDIPDIILSF